MNKHFGFLDVIIMVCDTSEKQDLDKFNRYWKARWLNDITEFNQKDPNPFLTHNIASLNLKANAAILVPLCGKSIDMLWLSQQKFNIIGIEISEIACKAFFHDNNLSYQKTFIDGSICFSGDRITLVCNDIFQASMNIISGIDAVYDCAALSALPIQIQKKYAIWITNLVKPNSMLIQTISYDQQQMSPPPYSIELDAITQL